MAVSVAELQPSETAQWLFTAWAGAAALAFAPFAIWRLIARRDNLPLLMIAGAVLASLVEPMLDRLGGIVYPADTPLVIYSNFGIDIPLLVVTGYILVMAVGGYVGYRWMNRGLDARGALKLWALLVAIDLAVEYPGIISDVYGYIGNQPFELFGFPLWWPVVNGTVMFAGAFAVWLVAPVLHGARRGLILLCAPLAVAGTYGLTAWPTFLALNSGAPEIVSWLAALATAGLCALLAWAMASVLRLGNTGGAALARIAGGSAAPGQD